jgi:hypothetical protein
VEKDELLKAVWRDTFVEEDHNMSVPCTRSRTWVMRPCGHHVRFFALCSSTSMPRRCAPTAQCS